MDFEAIAKTSLAEQVQQQILNFIRKNNLVVDDSLPPELVLACRPFLIPLGHRYGQVGR